MSHYLLQNIKKWAILEIFEQKVCLIEIVLLFLRVIFLKKYESN